METILKILQAVGSLIKEVTSAKVLLLFLLGIGGVFVSFTYENRQAIFTQVMASPYLLVGGTSGFLIVFLGYLFSVLVRRADERNEALFTQMQEQISQLKVQIEDCNERERECTKNFNALLLRLGISHDD